MPRVCALTSRYCSSLYHLSYHGILAWRRLRDILYILKVNDIKCLLYGYVNNQWGFKQSATAASRLVGNIHFHNEICVNIVYMSAFNSLVSEWLVIKHNDIFPTWFCRHSSSFVRQLSDSLSDSENSENPVGNYAQNVQIMKTKDLNYNFYSDYNFNFDFISDLYGLILILILILICF